MIKREHYVLKIRDFYDDDMIKIITGIRRCGKSVILEQIMDEIKKKSSNIIYLNFEDKKVISNIYDSDKLIEYVEKNRKKGKCYVFLDEIQEVKNWSEACKTLRLYDNSIFITGSNSKLLSKEFTKELSGRYVSFRIRPFVYKEILEYCAELNKECSVTDYLVWGGFPKRFEYDSESARDIYLNDLNDTIVINDIINRYKIHKISIFKSLVNYILKSNSRILSSKSIHDYINNNFENCSINTIIKYIEYLKEAFIIDEMKPYSSKTKSELKYYYKIYNADVSFNSIRCIDNRYDLTHNLENIVYNELLCMGYNVNVYYNGNYVIDFLAQRDGKKYYIQVAYSAINDKAYDEKLRAFSNLDYSCKKILITNDELDYSTSTVIHLKLKDFLLMDSLDKV